MAATLPTTDPVHKVSIIPARLGALGYTIQRPEEEALPHDDPELKEKMAVLMGGRAAEHVVFGEISTGAADDLDKISDIARHMVTRYGHGHGDPPGGLRSAAPVLSRRERHAHGPATQL